MAETGCATCDGRPTDCAHCWHSLVYPDRSVYECCCCRAVSLGLLPAPVPGYRDARATPPSTAFRRTDGEQT